MSAILTKELVKKALPIITGAHELFWDMDLLKRKDLHMVIMDPGKPYGTCGFKEAMLFEHSFTPPKYWEHPYAGIARQKASVTWRTGHPSRIVRECMPHLLAAGESRYGGSVNVDGLVVAASGVQPWYDEALSGIAAHVLKGVANEYMQTVVIPGQDDFLG